MATTALQSALAAAQQQQQEDADKLAAEQPDEGEGEGESGKAHRPEVVDAGAAQRAAAVGTVVDDSGPFWKPGLAQPPPAAAAAAAAATLGDGAAPQDEAQTAATALGEEDVAKVSAMPRRRSRRGPAVGVCRLPPWPSLCRPLAVRLCGCGCRLALRGLCARAVGAGL
jgi:hypothetical protein